MSIPKPYQMNLFSYMLGFRPRERSISASSKQTGKKPRDLSPSHQALREGWNYPINTKSMSKPNTNNNGVSFTSAEDAHVLAWKIANPTQPWASLDEEMGKPRGAAKARFLELKASLDILGGGQQQQQQHGNQWATGNDWESTNEKGRKQKLPSTKPKASATAHVQGQGRRKAQSDVDVNFADFDGAWPGMDKSLPGDDVSLSKRDMILLTALLYEDEQEKWWRIACRFGDKTGVNLHEDDVRAALAGK